MGQLTHIGDFRVGETSRRCWTQQLKVRRFVPTLQSVVALTTKSEPGGTKSGGAKSGDTRQWVEVLAEVVESSELTAVMCLDQSFNFAPLPDEIATLGSCDLRTHLVTDQLFDVVVASDHAAIARAFGIAKQTGMSGCRVRRSMRDEKNAGEEISLRFFDLCDRHGITLVLVGEFEDEWVDLVSVRTVDPRTRLLVNKSNATGHYEVVDPLTPDVLGWHPDDMVDLSGLDFVHPDDHERRSKPGSRFSPAWMAAGSASDSRRRTGTGCGWR